MLLVTGGTGFVGRNLVPKLLEEGKEVRLLARDPDTAENLFSDTGGSLEIMEGDLLARESLKKVTQDIDQVIHLAGLVSYSKPRELLFKINCTGTRNLLQACSNSNLKRFIFSSSVSVLGPTPRGQKTDEDSPYKPINPYGESKVHAEKDILQTDFPSVILRIAPIYGSGSPSWLKNLDLLKKGFPLPDIDTLTHVVHISDVVQAFLLSLEKKNEIYLIADEKPIKFLQLAKIIMENLGKEPRVWPKWLVNLAARLAGMRPYLQVLTMNRHYDISRAREELGFEPKANLKKEIEKMTDWYTSQKEETKKPKNE